MLRRHLESDTRRGQAINVNSYFVLKCSSLSRICFNKMHFLVLAHEVSLACWWVLGVGRGHERREVKSRVSVSTPGQRQVSDGQSGACSPHWISLGLTYTCEQFYFFLQYYKLMDGSNHAFSVSLSTKITDIQWKRINEYFFSQEIKYANFIERKII